MKRELWTRRQRALWCWGVLVLLLLLTLWDLGGNYIGGREQIWREQEERLGTGETELLQELQLALPLGRSYRLTLRANEKALLLGMDCWDLTEGWTNRGACGVDLAEEGPIHVGWWPIGRFREGWDLQDQVCYAFGMVEEPVCRIEFCLQTPWSGAAQTAATGRENWLTREGRTYFVFPVKPEPGLDENPVNYRLTVRCYDESGALLYEGEVEPEKRVSGL